MKAKELLQRQLELSHHTIEMTVAGASPEQLHHRADGTAMTIAANLAHIVAGEDRLLHFFVLKGTPLAEGEWKGRTGASEDLAFGMDMGAWAQTVQVDMEQTLAYAHEVWKQTTDFLASRSDEDLAQMVDFSAFGLGDLPMGTAFSLIIANNNWHTGEISAMKGLQGLQGYPF